MNIFYFFFFLGGCGLEHLLSKMKIYRHSWTTQSCLLLLALPRSLLSEAEEDVTLLAISAFFDSPLLLLLSSRNPSLSLSLCICMMPHEKCVNRCFNWHIYRTGSWGCSLDPRRRSSRSTTGRRFLGFEPPPTPPPPLSMPVSFIRFSASAASLASRLTFVFDDLIFV